MMGPRDRPGYREHVDALVCGVARRDQRSAALARLDHDQCAREPADQPVAQREERGERRDAERELADDRAALHDPLGELAVRRGIDAVDPARLHRDSAPARGERRLVSRRVDAECQPGDDHHTRGRELPRHAPRHLDPVRRRCAAADDRHRGLRERVEIAAHREHGRRIGELDERRRIAR